MATQGIHLGHFESQVWFNPLATTTAARDFNWHHVFAFWAAIPLIVIIPTASVFNYGWANTLVYTLAGDHPPERSNSAPPNPQDEPRNAVSLDVLADRPELQRQLENPQFQPAGPRGPECHFYAG